MKSALHEGRSSVLGGHAFFLTEHKRNLIDYT